MDDVTQIERAIEQFANAYNAGDLEAVLASYTYDLKKTRHGAPPETKPETAARIADVMSAFETNVDVINDEIVVDGDLAYTRGSFTVTLRPKAGGEPLAIQRRYLEIWRRENGSWLVARTMDNSE